MARSNFLKEMDRALKLIDQKKINAAARGGLKKYRETFKEEMARYMQSTLGILRPLAVIKERLEFKFKAPRTFEEGTKDRIQIEKTQFSFLAFKNNKRQFRRKNGTMSNRIVLDQVKIGGQFRSYKGVFVARGENDNLLPFRRKDPSDPRSDIESMQVNAYRAIALNAGKFESATDEYSKKVMVEIGKRMIRAMYRNLNKKVRFPVIKG